METSRVNVWIDNEQAKARLKEIQDELAEIKVMKDRAFAAGDITGFNKLTDESKKLTREAKNLEKKVIDVDGVLKSLSKVTLKELRAAIAKATKELNDMSRDDPRFELKRQQIAKLNAELRGTTSVVKKTPFLNPAFFKNLLPIASVAVFFTAFFAFFRRAINLSKELEKSLSSLSAITGVTGKDLEFFRKKSMEYSGQTLKSANDIVKAFELVGSIRPELLKNKEALAEVTKQAIILSEATGGKLSIEDAAKAASGVLNQFELANEDAARVVNALAAGSKFGAASVVQQTDALKDFGAVAKMGNVTLEQSIGLIETLAEKQIIGSEAGTKLRNILIVLQGDQKNYKNGIFDINLALENLARQNLSVTELTKLFGRESVVAASILVSSRDKVTTYTEAVTGTNTALEQQKIQTRNVESAIVSLTNKWENFILKINKSSGFLYSNLRFLNAIFDVINKNNDKDEPASLFSENGLINDVEAAKLGLEELDAELLKLKSDEKIFFENWLQKSGDEKAFWAMQYDLAKQNIDKIAKLMNEKKVEAVTPTTTDKPKPLTEEERKKMYDDYAKANEAAFLDAKNRGEARFAILELLKNDIDQITSEIGHRSLALEENVPDFDLDNIYKMGQLLFKEQYQNDKLTAEQYFEMLKDIEISHLTTMIEIRKRLKEESVDLELQLAEKRIDIKKDENNKEKEEAEKQLAIKQEWKAASIDMAHSLSDAIFSINADRINRELDLQLSKLDKQREAELKNKKLTEEQKDAINEKYRKKAAALQLEAWKKQQRADIISSIIKTALAVVNALSAGDPVTAPMRAIAAGVAGAAQTTVIAAQKPPEFRKGGYTRSSSSDYHEAGIVHTNEFVANADAKRNPTIKPVLDIIDMAQKSGAVRSINLPAVLNVAQAASRPQTADNAQSLQIDASAMIQAMNEFKMLVEDLKTNGIHGKWVYQDLKQIIEKEDAAIKHTR